MQIRIIIGLAGIIITWITLRNIFQAEPKEEKENLLASFLATQKLSKELRGIMAKHAILRDAFDIELYQGFTYRSYLVALEKSQQTNLSDELFEKVKQKKFKKATIRYMQKSLDTQYEGLQKIKSLVLMANSSFNDRSV